MKPYFYYGVDAYGNIHTFKSKGYRTELIDADKIRPLTFAEYQKKNQQIVIGVFVGSQNKRL